MKNELLALNPKTLQFLHRAAGFDFCKPYTIHRIDGRFTRRTVGELIPDGHTAVGLLVPDPDKLRYANRDDVYYIRITSDGFEFDQIRGLDYPNKWNCKKNRPCFDIDWLWTKGDFEEIRKKGTKHLYVITQSTDIITQTGRKNTINFTERFQYKIECRRLYIKRIDHNEKFFEYGNSYTYWSGARRIEKPENLIDKSGYIIDRRRADLYRRGAALKAARAKAAAAVADFSERYDELCADLKRNREQLAAAILDPEGYTNMCQYARRCYDLGYAQDYLDSYMVMVERKAFKSTQEMIDHLNRADSYINKEV